MAISNTAKLSSKIEDGTGQKRSVEANSNTLKTNKIDSDVVLVKSTSQSWVIPTDKVTVTTKITNNSALEIINPTIKDTLSAGATFVAGSVVIGSEAHTDVDPIAGFTPSLTIGGDGAEVDMTYQIQVDKYIDVSTITNSTQLTVNFGGNDFLLNSNMATINILNNEVYLLKTANTNAVKSADTIVYTITITNDGTLENTELFFTDPIPTGTTFVDGSVKVNGVTQSTYNPTTGFSLQDLGAGQSITVEFSVTVD